MNPIVQAAGAPMRFDDMIATMLDWSGDAAARDRVWLQLTDLLAQGRGEDDSEAGLRALAWLRSARDAVPLALRRQAAERLSGRRLPPSLVALFAEDADVSRPLLATVVLDRDEWRALLPSLGPVARAIVLARRDRPAPDAGEETPPAAGDGDQVRDLLARIAAFQADRSESEGFAFVIAADGRIVADGSVPLDARLGAEPNGVDGQAIGAWRAGTPLVDARLSVAAGPYAGEWRISATPVADGADGDARYRGAARRPRPDETAAPRIAAAPPEAARDPRIDVAIDDLRRPLAAMATARPAFGGATGPAATAADGVVERSLELIDAIESFDLAVAALEGDAPLDAAAVLGRLHAALSPLAEARGVTLTFRIARNLPAPAADPQAIERMYSRLLGAALGLARPRERLVVRLGLDREDGGRLALILTRPGRLIGRTAEVLRDPAPQADAATLAFGFALRLVERLAAEAGGILAIHDDRLRLALPHRAADDARRRG